VARTVYYAAMSLDGYIADPDENLEWLTEFDGPGFAGDAAAEGPIEGSYEPFIAGVGALVMGSKTYEFLLGENWPYEDLPVWVLTSRKLPPIAEAAGLRFASGGIAEVQREATAAAAGKVVWLVGGGNVASQYVEAGLLEILRVTVVPVVLGAGLPLFAGPVPPLRLLDTAAFGNGMVELTYEVVAT
jgi:dihydrofolate reductase